MPERNQVILTWPTLYVFFSTLSYFFFVIIEVWLSVFYVELDQKMCDPKKIYVLARFDPYLKFGLMPRAGRFNNSNFYDRIEDVISCNFEN